MKKYEELRMIRERLEQAQDALAEILAEERAADRLLALAGGTLTLLLVAVWALLRLVALAAG